MTRSMRKQHALLKKVHRALPRRPACMLRCCLLPPSPRSSRLPSSSPRPTTTKSPLAKTSPPNPFPCRRPYLTASKLQQFPQQKTHLTCLQVSFSIIHPRDGAVMFSPGAPVSRFRLCIIVTLCAGTVGVVLSQLYGDGGEVE